MFESLIILLLYIVLAALVVRLVIWVLDFAKVPIPANIIWAIFAVFVVIWLVRFLMMSGGFALPMP